MGSIGTLRGLWWPYGVLRGSIMVLWDHMGFSWDPWGPYGIHRDRMGSIVTSWGLSGPDGIHRDFIGFSWDPR